MHKLKEKFADEVYATVYEVCRDVFARSDAKITDPVGFTLGISAEQAADVINKIVTAIPDKYVYVGSKIIKKNIQDYIAKEFITFQAQEDYEADDYADMLVNFIYYTCDYIDENIYSELRRA